MGISRVARMPPGPIRSRTLRSTSVHGLQPEILIQVSTLTAFLTSRYSLSLCDLSGVPSLSVE